MSEQDIQKYEKMLEEDPQSRAFAPLAEAHRKMGNLDDAIRVAEAGLEIHPGYTGGLIVLGRSLYEKKELDKAEEVLKKAVTETPESYLGQKFLGKVLMEKGENQAALAALEAANIQSPDDGEVAELLEKIRPKAQPPEAMVYSDSEEGEDTEVARIVTYEQKPTTVDGVELEPLPMKADEETFTFSEIEEEKDLLQAEPLEGTEETAEAVVETEVITEVEPETAPEVEPESETLDSLGPEAAAFIEEADQLDDAIFSAPEEEIDEEEDSVTIEGLIEEVSLDPEEVQLLSPSPDQVDKEDEALIEQPSAAEIPPSAAGAEEIPPLPPEPPGGDFPVDDSQVVPASPPSAPDRSASGGEISTETLADLYARQGLVEKAVEIYRQILLERPSDEGIMAKLRELEGSAAAQPPADTSTVPKTPAQDMSSADTDDILDILDNWLQNAERMKEK
jgi:tetratricopeptide (TPR) repeat protein